MFKKVFTLFFLSFLVTVSLAQSARTKWVDSVFHSLNPQQKIGQLFMIPVNATSKEAILEIENSIKSHEVSGLIFKDIGPALMIRLVNHFQRISDVPLIIAYDPGVSSTLLDSATSFPPPGLLGAISNDALLYEYGTAVAEQLKLLGVNMYYGLNTMVLDPAPNPRPQMNTYGQDKHNVAGKSLAVMRGLQDQGIIACSNQFRVRGAIVSNTRNDLPVLEIIPDSVQRFPYTKLVDHGLKGFSPSPSEFRISFNDSSMRKTDLSPAAVSTLYSGQWMRANLNFEGLTFIDIRSIGKFSNDEKPGDAELITFETGNDVMMYPKDIPGAIRKIRKAVKKDDLYEKRLENTVKKILAAKFDAGLWERKDLSTDNLVRKLDRPDYALLNQKLYAAAITVIQNEDKTIPVKILENRNFAYLSGSSSGEAYSFFQHLNKYVHTDFFTLEDKTDQDQLQKTLSAFEVVIIGIFPDTPADFIDRARKITNQLNHKPEVIFCDFGHPSFLAQGHLYSSVITAYTANKETFRAVPQVIFGGISASGIIPFSPSKGLAAGAGVKTPALQRLAYSIPEDVKMDSRILHNVDSIAEEAIRIGATPGCQVLVARNGKVILDKTFGHLTYDNQSPVTPETIYDVASVTKVMATLQTAMFMHDRGVIDLNRKVSYYLPELKKTNKKDITMMDMLTHQSGLVPFIPLYNLTIKDTTFLPEYYSRQRNDQYPLQVSTNLYASPVLRDSVWSWIIKSKMTDKPVRTPYSYKYSDLGFLILQRVAETMLNQPLDEFVFQNLYEPLGSYTTGFNPLNRFAPHLIAPTEDDKIYRRTFVSGTVHDERAAMMGGVAGHAGLFSNATDLAKVGQMLLQNGEYGGVRYYKPETVKLFTARKFRTSRRGIGWDKPVQSSQNSPTSHLASQSTFGHTGFTGTCIWIDPEFDLVYIFLSNRVYPDRNNKLSNANIRSRIQDVLYKSIFGYVEQEKRPYIVSDFAINTAASRPLE